MINDLGEVRWWGGKTGGNRAEGGCDEDSV